MRLRLFYFDPTLKSLSSYDFTAVYTVDFIQQIHLDPAVNLGFNNRSRKCECKKQII